MNCHCISRVNENLAEQNLALDVEFERIGNQFEPALGIGTHWKDSSKKVRGKKPRTILVRFCPFCGKKTEKAAKKKGK